MLESSYLTLHITNSMLWGTLKNSDTIPMNLSDCCAQKTSKGFTDFCVRNVEQAAFGRREIEIAEQGETRLCGSAFIT